MSTPNYTARVLPEIVMAGIRFTIDARLNEFRETARPWNSISMDEISEENGLYGILINTDTHNVFREEVDPTNLPANVQLVHLPPILEMDPVGIARRYGYADDEFVKAGVERARHPEEAEVKPGRSL